LQQEARGGDFELIEGQIKRSSSDTCGEVLSLKITQHTLFNFKAPCFPLLE
jgi:hypothetical protein